MKLGLSASAAAVLGVSLAACTGEIRGVEDDASPRDAIVRMDVVSPPDAHEVETDTGAGTDTSAPIDAPPVSDRICEPWPGGVDRYDQSVAPIEILPESADATAIVLIAGPSSAHPGGQHEFFAGMAILAHVLCETEGVVPILVRDGWPADERVLHRADSIVLYADGGSSHPLADAARRASLARQLDRGVGLVAVHYAVEPSVEWAEILRGWLGGVYEPGYSVNPLWRARYEGFPEHPSTRGLAAFDIDDEWYFGIRFVEDTSRVTPILAAVPPDDRRTTPETMAHPGRSETTAWAFERSGGGRSFAFTGGHWHGNWGDSSDTPFAVMQRRVIAQAALWTAGVEIPLGGAPAPLDPALGGLWLDRR
ncbi:MAG: ThuA domain-containing protein [Deltaproteobacteria bacterium]|nr:ThuA domain-containing protein [Deltaproteobacteria bacterium]